ncbi:DUF2138 family protein [Yersinia pekkanenii]|uniref:DUF2138 family protein n=1 Tax=Yersinia pekkanenii TaxID=1288385 RepID=UPI00092CFECB
MVSAAALGFATISGEPTSHKSLKERVQHNNLQIDLHHPDVLIETTSLSQLLTITAPSSEYHPHLRGSIPVELRPGRLI